MTLDCALDDENRARAQYPSSNITRHYSNSLLPAAVSSKRSICLSQSHQDLTNVLQQYPNHSDRWLTAISTGPRRRDGSTKYTRCPVSRRPACFGTDKVNGDTENRSYRHSTKRQTEHSRSVISISHKWPNARLTATYASSIWLRFALVFLAVLFLLSPGLAAAADDSKSPTETESSSSVSVSSQFADASTSSSDKPSSVSDEEEEKSKEEDNGGGEIGIVGSFRGISTFNSGDGSSGGGTLKLDDSLISVVDLSSESADLLSSISSDGRVLATCAFYNKKTGSVTNIVFGGTFTQLDGTSVGYVVSVSSKGTFNTMKGGVNGQVNALYCDQQTNQVYIGGSFAYTKEGFSSSISTMNSQSTGNLAIYDFNKDGWVDIPFSGLDGTVYDITGSGDYIYAAGSFSSTVDNATHTALNRQPINLYACTITAGNSAEINGFNNPQNVICTNGSDSAGNTWLVRDGMPGDYHIIFPFKTTPSVLRIMNTMYQGRGTKSIRIEAAQNNQALTLAYISPETNSEVFCTQSCPLIHDYSWQEFRFVESDSLSNITGIVIHATDWYGEGSGWNKIELYQRDPRVYAIDAFNGSPCSSEPHQPGSISSGSWTTEQPSSYPSKYRSLTVNVDDINSEKARNSTVTLAPYIPEAGFYDVYMMIPGCQNTNTCRERSTAKVTLMLNRSRQVLIRVVQRNVQDQNILIYHGYSAATSSKFTPAISVSLSEDPELDPLATRAEIVVDSFNFIRTNSYTNLNGVIRMHNNFSSSLQDYEPLYIPLNDTLPEDSTVYSIAVIGTSDESSSKKRSDIKSEYDGAIVIAGEFSNDTAGYHNIAMYRDNELKPLNDTGINGKVNTMAFVDGSLFVGGRFSTTVGRDGNNDNAVALINIGQFNTSDGKWYPVSGGTDGPVKNIHPYSPFGPDVVSFCGSFNKLLASKAQGGEDIMSPRLTMWNVTSGKWISPPYIASTNEKSMPILFSDAWNSDRSNIAITVGKFSAVAAMQGSGTLVLSEDNKIGPLERLGFSLQPNSDGAFAVNAGLWYAKDNDTSTDPKLIVGGNFKTEDGTTNVAQLVDGKWEKLFDGVSGEVLTIMNAGTQLFIGGVANMTDDDGFKGLVVYEMEKGKLAKIPEFKPADDSSPARINRVAVRADTSMVIVGGNFLGSGSLDCPYICTWDINDSQWSPLPSSLLTDQVTDMLFVDNQLVVAGTFKNGTQPPKYIMIFDFNKDAWIDLPDSDKLPGPVISLAPENHNDTKLSFYAAGTNDNSSYIAMHNGESFTIYNSGIDNGSKVRGIVQVPETRVPSKFATSIQKKRQKVTRASTINTIFPEGYVLAVYGDLHLSGTKQVSAAFFDGNNWTPFLSTIQQGGDPGYISSVFYENPPTKVNQKHRMSTGLVILIAVAIALGITFIIVLIGLVYVYMRNRREAAATASAASAAAAAAAGGLGSVAKPPLNAAVLQKGGALRRSSVPVAPAAKPTNITHGNRGTWGDSAFVGDTVKFNNVAPNTERATSGVSGAAAAAAAATANTATNSRGLASLAKNDRHVPVSSETYVNRDSQISDSGNLSGDESLDSIFESAAAEAEAEQHAASIENAASMPIMPTPHHYDQHGNHLGNTARSLNNSNSGSRTSVYRPDSTNPFEQRLAMRSSQSTSGLGPAGPYSDEMGPVPMPAPHTDSSDEHGNVAMLSRATAVGAIAGQGANQTRDRSVSDSSADTTGQDSGVSRPSGESSANASAAHLPIRDSLRQYPVYYAKFTFSSRETGELGFRAGERVFVIDQSDEIWWMGIVDHGAEQPLEQGVFPATYVSNEPPRSTDWADLM